MPLAGTLPAGRGHRPGVRSPGRGLVWFPAPSDLLAGFTALEPGGEGRTFEPPPPEQVGSLPRFAGEQTAQGGYDLFPGSPSKLDTETLPAC